MLALEADEGPSAKTSRISTKSSLVGEEGMVDGQAGPPCLIPRGCLRGVVGKISVGGGMGLSHSCSKEG